jgi:hypothetical protein
MLNWIRDAYHWATGSIGGTIVGWVHGLVSGLWKYLESIFSPVEKAWDDFANSWSNIEKFFYDFFQSVYHRITDIYDWINKEGYLAYYYISHPGKLALRVIDGIAAMTEDDAIEAAEGAGKFVLNIIYKNPKDVAKAIEDILDAIF